MSDENTRELTSGERLAGVTFNPSGDPAVTKAKQTFAELIEQMMQEADRAESREGNIVAMSAVQSLITSQMLVVKTLTWREPS